MASLPEEFKTKPGPKFVPTMVRNNSKDKSHKGVPDSEKQAPGKKGK